MTDFFAGFMIGGVAATIFYGALYYFFVVKKGV